MAVAACFRKRGHEDDGDGEANKKLRCSPEDDSEPLKIEVGTERYSMDKARLCSSSGFFRSILNSTDWKKKNSNTYFLYWDNPEIFKTYAKWFDSGKIYIGDGKLVEEADTINNEELRIIFLCYRAANILEDDDFKDAIMDAMISIMVNENTILRDLPTVIYNYSEATSPHRQLVIDCVANTWPEWCFEDIADGRYSTQFVRDMLTAMGTRLRGVTRVDPDDFFQDVDICKWHEHTKKHAPCYKDKYKISSKVDGTSST